MALLDRIFFVNRDEQGLMSWESLNAGAAWYPNLHQYSSWVDHDHIGLVTTLEKTFDKGDKKTYSSRKIICQSNISE